MTSLNYSYIVMKESDTRKNIKQATAACVSRRGFITACSACAACLAFRPGSFLTPSATAGYQGAKMKIRIVYSLLGILTS